MHIYTDKRTGIKYISYTDPSGRRIRRSLGTRNKSVATLKAADVLGPNDSERGYLPDCDFMDLVARYKAEVLALRAKGTHDRFMSALHRLEEFGLPKTIKEVTPAFLQKFQVFLKEKSTSGKSGGINRNVRAIRTLMRLAPPTADLVGADGRVTEIPLESFTSPQSEAPPSKEDLSISPGLPRF